MTRRLDFPDGFSSANPPPNISIAETDSQTIGAGGELSVTDNSISILHIEGTAGPETLSTTPFGTSVPEGHIIILIGSSDTNPVTLVNSGLIDNGADINGDIILKKGYSISLVKKATPNRFYEQGRNV